jgi:hypothetical protein
MKSHTSGALIASIAVALGVLAAGCAEQQVAATPRIEEKTFALAPATVPVEIGVLSGSLADLQVVERVNEETGAVVSPPQLRGTLKLANRSADVAVSPLGGSIEFLDAEGRPIRLAEGRTDTSFTFSAYSTERLDPGAAMSRQIDVPFPAAALEQKSLADLRVVVTYLPLPYERESATVSTKVGEAS